MPKKSFTTAPKPKVPTSETIDAYVRGGAGHDTVSRQTALQKPQEGPTKRLSLDMPEDMHRRFKAACAATGRKMAAELLAFIEARTAELEDENRK